MQHQQFLLAFALVVGPALALSNSSSKPASCKTVKPVDGLDLKEYISKTWYIQEQQVTGYLPVEQNFCVTATYQEGSQTVPLFNGKVVQVENYSNKDKVNGRVSATSNSTALCARQPNSEEAAKLLVAPCFLPNLLAGDYWVVAVGKNYEWAVVSGGQPTVQYDDGCTTKEEGTNGSGFWFFSRAPMASDSTLAEMRQAAKGLGFTLSRLNKVQQEGCKYAGAVIKR